MQTEKKKGGGDIIKLSGKKRVIHSALLTFCCDHLFMFNQISPHSQSLCALLCWELGNSSWYVIDST